jgi:hypothetical protein
MATGYNAESRGDAKAEMVSYIVGGGDCSETSIKRMSLKDICINWEFYLEKSKKPFEEDASNG